MFFEKFYCIKFYCLNFVCVLGYWWGICGVFREGVDEWWWGWKGLFKFLELKLREGRLKF